MPTVIVHGGLGNQLFRYAVGRAISVKTGTKLRLETSTFARSLSSGHSARILHLPAFSVEGEFVRAPIEDDLLLKGRFRAYNLLKKVSPNIALQTCGVHRDLERPHHFSPHVLDAPGRSVLYGYYQSERYFRPIADTLRTELSLRKEPGRANRHLKPQIETEMSIGIHVRRGDYAMQGWALPTEYYRSAIGKISRMVDDPCFFFFSDEVALMTSLKPDRDAALRGYLQGLRQAWPRAHPLLHGEPPEA